MSSWTPVDFGLVRYSPIEGTHYFYDSNSPTAIQFLLNGRWESWDVSYVKFKAKDPEIRRIAEGAESRVVADNLVPGYTQWPSPPPPGGPAVGDHTPSTEAIASPVHSANGLHRDSHSASPNQPLPLPALHSQPSSPHAQPASDPPAPTEPYASPYTAERQPEWQDETSRLSGVRYIERTPLQPLITDLPVSTNGVQQAGHTHYGSHPPSTATPSMVPSKKRETKILLSLDGDGVCGLSQVLLVESLVNAVCTKIGAQIDPYQVFDLIGGCSMGGILAVLLSRLRMQAHRARDAYKLISKEVYRNKRKFFTSLDPHGSTANDDTHMVEETIRAVVAGELVSPDDLFLDSREDSSDVFLVTTQIDIGTNKAGLIRSFATRRITGPELDTNMSIWQAMRATSIAPRYMVPRDGGTGRPIIAPGLVDHGTAKNNPVRDIRFECSKLYRYGNDTMVIVSLGTGTGHAEDQDPEIAKSCHDRTVEAGLSGDRFETDHQALMERGWVKYFRFNADLSNVPLEEWCQEEMIKEKTSAYLARPEVGQMFYTCVDVITTVLLSGNMGRDPVPPSW